MKLLQLAFCCWLLSAVSLAEATRTWQQSKYEEFEKGTAHGIAINSGGSLTLAPRFDSLFTTPSTYLWSLAADAQGNVYAAAGTPARVYRITPDGKASIILAPEELQVQALVVSPAGTIYAATSPDGKVYKLVRGGPTPGITPEGTHTTAEIAAAQEGQKPGPKGEKPKPSVAVDGSYTATIFFDPKTKYIWALALDRQGQLYVGTGDRGEVYRVDPKGNGSLFFKSDEAHIRVLQLDSIGNLIAGTDGSGLLYRITPKGEAFVLYSAPKKEITALAIDGHNNIYAAGAGDKRAMPPSAGTTGAVPTTGMLGSPVTPAGAAVAGTAGISPFAAVPYPSVASLGGSEIYRLSPDGSPKTIWSSRDDLVYALAFDASGQLLAGTGNKGKIYGIRDNDEYTDLVKASANQITAFAPAPQGGLYAATSNLGKVFVFGPNLVSQGSYESDVFDARNFSKWGRFEVRGRGNFDVYGRTGNVDNPDRNWSPWKKLDLKQELPVDAPQARFIQWKAELRPANPATELDSVLVNYLPKNVAPEVDNVTVLVGSRVPPGTRTSNTGSSGKENQALEPPIPTIKDKQSVAVRWRAHDDNDDDLTYSIYYRGDGETRWKLLRDEIEDRYANLDADLFPDGGYTIRVVASDSPSQPAEEALTGDAASSRFEVDNTPPRIEALRGTVAGDTVRVTFRAVDSFSPITRAEYSIDAGDWQLIQPVGQISDYRIENYDVMLPLNGKKSAELEKTAHRESDSAESEHTIVVRAYDRFDNVGIGKTTVHAGR